MGAWANRKYTELPSSFILGLIPSLAIGGVLLTVAAQGGDWLAVVLFSVFLLFQALFYPLARETYYRLTQPLRRGLGIWIIPLPIVVIGWILKLYIYVILWVLALPIGIAGFCYLAITERNGKGWRPASAT